MALMGIDIGTTHTKVALHREDGKTLALVSGQTPSQSHPDGHWEIDPRELWKLVAGLVQQACADLAGQQVSSIGISSMAESGLLVSRETGDLLSPILPWFDPASSAQADQILQKTSPKELFLRTGQHPGFKCSLAKILWLRDGGQSIPPNAVWLSAADFIAFCFTGKMATDPSLACRTLAFNLAEKNWDAPWLAEFGLSPDIFPALRPSGAICGIVQQAAERDCQLPAGIPVAICGHDHLCAAFGLGAVHPGDVLDSMGTAEAVLGVCEEKRLGEAEYDSGLSFGYHTAPGRMYWIGGMSASGGSLDWLRSILSDPPLSYAALDELANTLLPGPSGILYFPYLAGSGAPHSDIHLPGAWIGLSAGTTRADMLKAVLEGTAFEAEWIRRQGANFTSLEPAVISACGGGSKLPAWMQIKADIAGRAYQVFGAGDATAAGAALLAGIGAGVYSSPVQALESWKRTATQRFEPDAGRHLRYHDVFEKRYVAFQAPYREWNRAGHMHNASDG